MFILSVTGFINKCNNWNKTCKYQINIEKHLYLSYNYIKYKTNKHILQRQVDFMNVYDFDNTIYNGESAFDFFIFCLRKKPVLLKVLFPILYDAAKYKLCKMTDEQFRDRGAYYTESFFYLFPDIQGLVKEFWDKHQHKIKPFYSKNQKDDDVIVTANVNILVEEMFRRMGVKNYISTMFDMESGRLGEICFGEAKAILFKQKYGTAIDDFYTDSENDAPLMALAKKVYMVRKNKIKVLKKR